MTHHTPNCPACGKPLRIGWEFYPEDGSGATLIYCGHSQCPCDAMNDGATGRTVELAYERLVEVWESQTARKGSDE